MYLTKYRPGGTILRRDYPSLDALSSSVDDILEQMAKKRHALRLSPHIVELVWLVHPDRNERISRLASHSWLPGAEYLPPAWRAGLARWLEVRRPSRRTAASIVVCGVLPILVPQSGGPRLSPEQEELLFWLYPSPYRWLNRRDWRLLWTRYPDLRRELKHCSPILADQPTYADLTLV
jgi:hypothetical protein